MTVKGIIVLEGPDASGKSTLAGVFAELYGAKVIHATYRFKNNMFAYHTALLKQAIAESQHRLVVVDRLWLSEQVYANVFRGGSRWPLAGRFVDRMLLRFGALNVICAPSTLQVSIDNHRKNLDPDHPYDDAKFAKVYSGYAEAYDQLGDRLDYDGYSYDVDGRNVYDAADHLVVRLSKIRAALQDKLSLSQTSPSFENLGGSAAFSKVLVVGEQVNPKYRTVAWPFYEHDNSSLYLAQTLEDLGISEYDMCFMNAVCPDDQDTTNRLLAQLAKKKRVVCLGNAAYKAMRQLVPEDKRLRLVPHPAYAQRFQGKLTEAGQTYKQLLGDAFDVLFSN